MPKSNPERHRKENTPWDNDISHIKTKQTTQTKPSDFLTNAHFLNHLDKPTINLLEITPKNISTNSIEMATTSQPRLDFNMIKLRLSIISNFDGSSETLNAFIYLYEKFLKSQQVHLQEHESLFFDLIQAKLVDRAKVGARSYTEWESFKADLRTAFFTGKELNNLIAEINYANKNPSETLFNFFI